MGAKGNRGTKSNLRAGEHLQGTRQKSSSGPKGRLTLISLQKPDE